MICLPGATAFVPALVVSGLPNNEFLFAGFLPQKKEDKPSLSSLQKKKNNRFIRKSA
jgi:16S rRNA (cytidine1402-2'-O)-methyltransferase